MRVGYSSSIFGVISRRCSTRILTNLIGDDELVSVTVERESRYIPEPKGAVLFTNDTAQAPIDSGVAIRATAPPTPVPCCPGAVPCTRLARKATGAPAVRARVLPVLE